MKNILKSVLIIALVGALSGCYPTGERRVESTTILTSNSEPNEKGEIDNTKIELEVGDMRANIYNLPTEYPAEAPVITLTLREWDVEELKQKFIGENTIKEDFSTFNENVSRYGYVVTDSNGDDYWFVSEQGRFELEYEDDYASWAQFIGSICEDGHCFDKLVGSAELAGFTKADAMKRVDKIIEKLGLSNITEPEIWSVTADKANDFFADYKHEDEVHWTQDEEVYIMKYTQTYNDIPIITKDKAIPTIRRGFFNGTAITAIVSKDRILSFKCSKVFSDEPTIGSTAAVKYSPVEAFDTLVPIYKNIKLGYTLDYYNCKLVYRACDRTDDYLTYSFTPAWQFDYSYENRTIGIAQGFELVDADTGVRIVNPEG